MPSKPAETETETGTLRQRHPPSSTSSTTTTTVTTAAKQLEDKLQTTLTLLWDDLPPWRRDNAFIVRGYRHTSNSYLGSLASLSYLHNESVNIWTHLLGAFAFTLAGTFLHHVVAPRYASASDADRLVLGCFFGGAFLCLGMSATYHTLCNHSSEVARWGNKLDYTGIVFLIVGSYVPALYYALFCHPALMTAYLTTVSYIALPASLTRAQFPPAEYPLRGSCVTKLKLTNYLVNRSRCWDSAA